METMKELKGNQLLQNLGLRNGEKVRVGKTVYVYTHERGTKWDRLTPVVKKVGNNG
jgi:hypothetical protein